MANTVKLKRSSVAGKVPTTSDLQLGELALNTHDGKLFTKKNDGTETIVDLSGGDVILDAGTAGSPSLSFTNDTNTGIYSPGADQVAISTNGTGRLFVDSSGNVGVNTATPTSDLSFGSSVGTICSDTASGSDNKALLMCGGGTGSIVRGGYLAVYGQDHATTPGNALLTSSTATGSNVIIQGRSTTSSIILNIGTSEKARLDSSGKLLVGASSAVGDYGLQVEQSLGSDPFTGSILLRRGLSNAALSGADYYLGAISAGSQTNIGGSIRFETDAAWGSGDYPTRLTFSTTAVGNPSPTERMRIDSSGAVRIGSAGTLGTADRLLVYESDATTSTVVSVENASLGDGKAAFFDVTANTAGGSQRRAYIGVQKQAGQTNPCAVLYLGTQDGANNYHWIDDNNNLRIGTNAQIGTTGGSEYAKNYEEGTFTPTIISGFTSPTYTSNTGIYTRIGNIVRFHLRVDLSGGTATAGQIRIDGLPFTCENTASQWVTCTYYLSGGGGTLGNSLKPLVAPNTNDVRIYKQNNTNVSDVAGTEIGNTFDIVLQGVYQI